MQPNRRSVTIIRKYVRNLTLSEPPVPQTFLAVPELLKVAQVCDALDCSESFLARLEREGKLVPARDGNGKWVRYHPRDVAAYVDARIAANRAEIARTA